VCLAEEYSRGVTVTLAAGIPGHPFANESPRRLRSQGAKEILHLIRDKGCRYLPAVCRADPLDSAAYSRSGEARCGLSITFRRGQQ